jgi:hypothetical protein
MILSLKPLAQQWGRLISQFIVNWVSGIEEADKVYVGSNYDEYCVNDAAH